MGRIETAEAPVVAAAKVLAFKGFDMDLSCTPDGKKFQFAIGESYSVDGEVQACRNGFHACPYPLDVFKYYAPANHRFAVVELSGDMDVDGDKTAARTITVVKEVTIREMVETAVQLTIERAKLEDGMQATGTRGAASATGYQGAASATGTRGAASATGTRGAASATGYQGAASATGTRGAASATGYQGAASATGYQGAASATGELGAASATGYQGAASATGTRGAASATGELGAASATGELGAASATGELGAASATGYQGAASAKGKFSVAVASGLNGKASGIDGAALCLVERLENWGAVDHGKIIAVWAGIVGQDGIKADTFYTLQSGKPVEVA